jgi:hypothetical protein
MRTPLQAWRSNPQCEPDVTGWAAADPADLDRVFLVSLQRPGPLATGRPPLQHVHVMVVRSGETAHLDVPVSLVTVLPRAHPAQLRSSGGAEAGPFPYAIRGDIFWSDGERFFEKVGPRIVPLRALATGPGGEILAFRAPRALAADSEPVIEMDREPEPPGPQAPPAARTRCLVRWGDFQHMLRGQIAGPERLRESHRLPCCVQVYEATRPQSLPALASAVLGEASGLERVQLLDADAAARLGLTGLLRGRLRQGGQRPPGVVLPGDLVFRLRVESDPTAAFSAPSSPEAARPPPKRTSVPEIYLKPWELVRSREEALYEMALEAASDGPLRRLFARLRRCFGGGRETRRWRALLEGKTPEEQLWAVRLPCASPFDPEVRSWAERTLDQAGYDARTMLREWEIYWRRKRIR